MNSRSGRPLRVALVNDYHIVVRGIHHFFDSYPDTVRVVEGADGGVSAEDADVVLFDTFGQGEPDVQRLARLTAPPHAPRLVVYTWVSSDASVAAALEAGAAGYLAKSLTAAALVDALCRVAAGEIVVRPASEERETFVGGEWPGRAEGLTAREAEILAMIAQGRSNQELAALTHLSINSVKSYIRNAYRKAGVTRRSQAVAWALTHGFQPLVKRPAYA